MKEVIKYILVYVIIVATAGLVVPPVYRLISGSADDKVMPLIITAAVYSVVSFIVFYRLRWCPLSSEYMRSKPYGVLFWVVLFSLGTVIPVTVLQELMPNLPNLVEDRMDMLIDHNFGYVTLCLFAPLVEEMLFRGAILRKLLDVVSGNKWKAITLSALIFAVVHMNPAQMPHAFVAGLFLGWLYSRTGSIVPGVVYHWINNTAVFVMCRALPPEVVNGNFSLVFGGSYRHEALAVIFSLFILLPSLYQIVLRTEK